VTERLVTLRVQRQASPTAPPRWEGFTLQWRADLTVATCLAELRDRAAAAASFGAGDPGASPAERAPIEWTECRGRCTGACAMRINGAARPACTTRIDALAPGVITVQPLMKFLVVCDLIVDREPMIANIEALRMGAGSAGSSGAGPATVGDASGDPALAVARCTQCGLCLEACPQVNERSDYMGPAPIVHALLFNALPSGRATATRRLAAIMGRGGIADCGNAQNCVEICPERIPLTEALAALARQTTTQWFDGLLRR
jgi:succinate dehydrogenase / fumarate reductase iron-sulfur subunit